jgi:hypothetical protein
MRRWHWKAAVLSAIVRGGLFFVTHLTEGVGIAERAALIEIILRVPLVGVLAAVTQALGCAEPSRMAPLAAMALLPTVAHLGELVVHWTAHTPDLGRSLLASITLSVLSTMFSLFVMRRGVMTVGDSSRSFSGDLKRLPTLALEFGVVLPLGFVRRLVGATHRTGRGRFPA